MGSELSRLTGRNRIVSSALGPRARPAWRFRLEPAPAAPDNQAAHAPFTVALDPGPAPRGAPRAHRPGLSPAHSHDRAGHPRSAAGRHLCPAPIGARQPHRAPVAAPGAQDPLASTALAYRGIRYRNGGADPDGGFDCSGLVWYVLAQHGIAVPRTVVEQYRVGTGVSARNCAPGDLVFFNTTGVSPSHVGISVGGDEFVHAPNSPGRCGWSTSARALTGPRRVRAGSGGSSEPSSERRPGWRARPPCAVPCGSAVGRRRR